MRFAQVGTPLRWRIQKAFPLREGLDLVISVSMVELFQRSVFEFHGPVSRQHSLDYEFGTEFTKGTCPP